VTVPQDSDTAQDWNRLLTLVAGPGVVPAVGTAEETVLRLVAAHFATALRVPEPLIETPAWLNEAARGALLSEAREVRHRAIDLPGQRLAHGGRLGQGICLSPALRGWIEEVCGLAVAAEMRSAYLYYEAEGDYCPVHVDVPPGFELSVLALLEHESPEPPREPSTTFFLTPDGIRRIPLRPGEAMVFHAGAVLHGRTPLGPGERVTLLSIGLTLAV
jgi:hypothetical protein